MQNGQVTREEDQAVLEELRAREPIFHRPEHTPTRADAEAMMAEDFWEIGASGRCYSREFVLDALEARYAEPVDDPWEARDFGCRCLAADLYLLTYTLLQGERVSRRATIWQRSGARWRVVFHQGTLVAQR
jgi:hypothetical protein